MPSLFTVARSESARAAGLRNKIAARTLKLLNLDAPPRRDWVSHLRGRYTVYLFGAAHLVLSFVVWYHHFFIKLTEKEKEVPEGAPHWTLKRFMPAIDFGMMHVLLFQMALIPLTMCRFSLAFLSTTPLSNVIPFGHAVDFHIFLGYMFSICMIFALSLFLPFFLIVCIDDRDTPEACRKFTSEIMLTGYAILFCTLVVLVSSFFRKRLKFECFYVLHHLALIMMLLSVLHTMDDEFRAGTEVGRKRSQAFKWFTTSLVIYLGDRFWQHLSASRDVPIVSLAVARDQSVLILNLRKPSKFEFAAGQHAFIQIPAIDLTYHPFTIGSAPSSSQLTFIVEIQKPGSWTHKLAMLKAVDDVRVNIMGGFGTPAAGKQEYSEVVAIGTGSGVVPMMSLMSEHAHRLRFLQKSAWQDAAHASLSWKQPLPLGLCFLQTRVRWESLQQGGLACPHMRAIAGRACWVRIHNVVGLAASFWLLFELYLLSSSGSFAGLPTEAPTVESQADHLRICTLVAVSVYAAFRLFMWLTPKSLRPTRLAKVTASVDTLLVFLAALLLGSWWGDKSAWLAPTLGQQFVRTALSLWRLIMLWSMSPANHQFQSRATANKLMGVRKFTLIWCCPSAHLVGGYLQVFENMVAVLACELGCTPAAVQSCLDIRVHCTEKDEGRLKHLSGVADTCKHSKRFLHFGRPDLNEVVRSAMERQLMHGLNGLGSSHTLVTFCGSRQVAHLLQGSVEDANGLADSLGLNTHRISFCEKFY